MKRYLLITALTVAFACGINAQGKKWTLEECINYAVTNNISLQRQSLQTEMVKADLLQSKMAVLPSLNAGSDGRVGFGRSVDPVTNLITFKQNISHSYYITSNVTIFNGFATMNTIAANKFMLKAGIENEKVQRNALIIDILGQYYRVVYTKGLERASEMKLGSSEEQLRRIVKMVETGKEALSKQYEMESRVSADRLDYTVARNTASQALTSLRQMLQLDPAQEFDIEIPDVTNMAVVDETFDSDSIYDIAARTLPRLKAIEYQLAANKKQYAAAKGLILPSLTAGGQIFTGFYKVIGEESASQMAYPTQLKNNNSQAVFLSLDIPLFNNYRSGRNIRLAKIRRDDMALRLEQEKNTLYTEIENACFDYNRGKDEFLAAKSNLDYNNKSFEAVEKKFESGLVDVTDYSLAKTTLFQAEMESLRTSLQLTIRRMTISFYTTGEYEQMFQ
ncbi:MAG TPA: TolC family protein [Bacteroidales bacterium]|nr:TolC family protein [Bacteroidales bacterium]